MNLDAAREARRCTPELEALVHLFYEKLEDLGSCEEIQPGELAEPYRTLLDHDAHMTVTVEAHHGCEVAVDVLQTHRTDAHYSRKILLNRKRDGTVVQFGVVRLNLDYLGDEVRAEIEAQKVPLGRILIQHEVLRNVRLLSLWRIQPANDLCHLLGLAKPVECYGRTALIYCNGVPAVELLEIVVPESVAASA